MACEPCLECGGTGRTRVEMGFGYIEPTCTFCDGTGQIRKDQLFSWVDAIRQQVTENVFKPSPLLAALKRQVRGDEPAVRPE